MKQFAEIKSEWMYLSHFIHPHAPAYGGNQAFFDEPDKQLENRDSCNTRRWRMSNHVGTHIDAPRHFSRNGAPIDHYAADFWLFSQVAIIVLDRIEPGRILNANDLDFSRVLADVELLLIKTGFGEWRQKMEYWQNNPGLHPEIAPKLRQNYPELRVIGFDLISLSSFANRSLGRDAHRSFLDDPKPILLLEDMDLSEIDRGSQIKQVVISPIRVKDADAAPCTVLAEVKR